MSTILPSRKVKTTGLLSRGFPYSSVSCAVPMILVSPTSVNDRFSIAHPPPAFKISRASSGPRHEGVCFHQRWPLVTPRHSVSSAKRETNGSGPPWFSASAVARSWSIMVEVLRAYADLPASWPAAKGTPQLDTGSPRVHGTDDRGQRQR